MKQYTIKQYTAAEFDAIDEYSWNDDEIVIIEKKDAYCMDITANGKRIVPILRKIEATMTAAGLAGDDGIYAGWFGVWADCLTDRRDRKEFIWNYSGKVDRERGCWTYSWGIEQVNDDQWYIFLNIAKPAEEVITMKIENTVTRINFEQACEAVQNASQRSAWARGVRMYALEMLAELEENVMERYISPEALLERRGIRSAILNGAKDFRQYSEGGCALIYDYDICRRLCTPTERKRTRDGERNPNGRETWLDVQARALYQAYELVDRAIRAAVTTVTVTENVTERAAQSVSA